ncbi:hypothetical protein UG56_004890 [Nocardioides luteus]|uniref:SRPBCC family protein n=2 Tax=Nocardioides luteus TaxID=1844 RepID=A0A1J4NAR8_9ACTN|nr:hypothetical protein UG56_004890 [Nocardioides luteus]
MNKAALLAAGSGAALAAAGAYVGVVTGRITIDLGVGRRTRPLGPITLDIAAPRETVFAVAAAPYAERRPRAMEEKVEILAREGRALIVAHHTPVGLGLTATTVETVVLEEPDCIGFQLMRGPVPHVAETFVFEPTESGTRLTYTGELATDQWRLGGLWGDLVARSWVAAVAKSLDAIRAESERRA